MRKVIAEYKAKLRKNTKRNYKDMLLQCPIPRAKSCERNYKDMLLQCPIPRAKRVCWGAGKQVNTVTSFFPGV